MTLRPSDPKAGAYSDEQTSFPPELRQETDLNAPAAELEKATVPDGTDPPAFASPTVAVQVVFAATIWVPGEQPTTTVVPSGPVELVVNDVKDVAVDVEGLLETLQDQVDGLPDDARIAAIGHEDDELVAAEPAYLGGAGKTVGDLDEALANLDQQLIAG